MSIKQDTGETYRQFYDKLLSHARLHLPKNVTVDGIVAGQAGEQMSIHLMNFVAMDWLGRINGQLIDIVKKEYSRELRENTQLAELVPRIAVNVDALLSRHDVVGGVEKLSLDDEDDVPVDKVNRFRHGGGRGPGRGRRVGGVDRSRNRLFCPECHLLGRKLNLQVDYKHFPADCPRPRAAINLMLAGEEDWLEENDDLTGNYENSFISNPTSKDSQMNSEDEIESSVILLIPLELNDCLLVGSSAYMRDELLLCL